MHVFILVCKTILQTFEAVIPKLLVPSGPFAVTSDSSPVTMRKQDSTGTFSNNLVWTKMSQAVKKLHDKNNDSIGLK